VLRAATQLDELSLEMRPMPTVGVLDPNFTYPHLRKAQFLSGDVDPGLLIAFLQDHRLTLRELELHYRALATSTWEATLDEMKRRRFVSDVCIFRNVYDKNAVGRYGLGHMAR